MKRTLAIIIVLTMLFAMAACGSTSETSNGNNGTATTNSTSTTPKVTDVELVGSDGGRQVEDDEMFDKIVVATDEDTATFSPFQGGGAFALDIFYQRLSIIQNRGEAPTLVIAKSYEQVGDLSFDVEIWNNIYDTNGEHLTAKDVAFCYNTARGIAKFNHLPLIENIEVTGEYTLRFTLNAMNCGDWETIMTEVPLVTQVSYEASPDGMVTVPIGTSGYTCTNLVVGSGFTAVYSGSTWMDNENIPMLHRHNVKEIEFKYISEQAQVRIALETGAVDIADCVSDTDLSTFMDGGAFSETYDVYGDVDSKQYFIEFNGSNDSICANKALRQAICYAINPEAINAIVFGGDAVVSSTVGSNRAGDYNPSWETDGYYDYDTEAALKKLEESEMRNVTVRLLTSSQAKDQAIAQVIQTNLEDVGISCELVSYQSNMIEDIIRDSTAWDFFLDAKAGEDYMFNQWVKWADADSWYGTTRGFVEDEKLQELLVLNRGVDTHNQEVVDELHQYIEDNAYAYGLMQAKIYTVYNGEKISELAVNRKLFPVPGACTYITSE